MTAVQRIALRDRMLHTFEAAAKLRDRRPEIVDDHGRPEPAWVLYERAQMLVTINQARREQGKAPLADDTVMRAERLACGHVDYAEKYALYCAEIVLDQFSAARP
jgi:hypothetical protein